MSRGFGCFLLALGALACVFGGIGTAVALGQLNRGGAGMLVAFLLLDVFGIGLLLFAIFALRRADRKKAVEKAAHAEIPGHYPANVAVQHELDETPFTVHYVPPVKGKNAKPSVLTVSTGVECQCEFQMVVETWFDKFCKRWGIAKELETGDAKFDDECYVRSDSPAFTAAYLADPVKRIAILDLRRFGFPELTLEGGTLSVKWTGFNPATDHRDELRDEVAARLLLLARNLPAHQPEFDERTGGDRRFWQVVLWLFLVGFALTALSMIRFTPLHTSEVLLRSLPVLLLGWPVFAYLSAWLVSGTSRSHLAWSGLMIGSLFLIPVGSAGLVALLNGLLDNSPANTRDALIVEKYTTRSKNSTNHHVRVQSWRNPGQTESFQIPSRDYGSVVPHKSKLVVVTRDGALGIEWFESKHVDANPKP